MQLTDTQAVEILASEGYRREDINSALDQLIAAGLELEQPDEGRLFAEEEIYLARQQILTSRLREEYPDDVAAAMVTMLTAGITPEQYGYAAAKIRG